MSGVKLTDPDACGTCGITGPWGTEGGMTSSGAGLLLGAGVG